MDYSGNYVKCVLIINLGNSEVTMNPPGKSFEEFIQSAPEGRYHGIERTYGAADVARLRGSV